MKKNVQIVATLDEEMIEVEASVSEEITVVDMFNVWLALAKDLREQVSGIPKIVVETVLNFIEAFQQVDRETDEVQ